MLHSRQSNNGEEALVLQLFAYLESNDLVRYAAVGSASMVVYMAIFTWLARRWGDERIGLASFWAFAIYLPINYPLVKLYSFSQRDWAAMSDGDTVYFVKELALCVLNIWMLKTAVELQIFRGRPVVNQTFASLLPGLLGYCVGKYFWV